MSINYNPATGLPYFRTNSLCILYNDDHVVAILKRGEALYAGGRVFKLAAPETEFQFRLNKDAEGLSRQYPLRDLSTGETVEGHTTLAQAIACIFAITRAHELESDAANA